jgi:hypothetical protein
MLMCDDLEGTQAELAAQGVEFTRPPEEASWGRVTAFRLPGGAEVGLSELRLRVRRGWSRPRGGAAYRYSPAPLRGAAEPQPTSRPA